MLTKVVDLTVYMIIYVIAYNLRKRKWHIHIHVYIAVFASSIVFTKHSEESSYYITMAHGLADSEMKKEYFDDQQTLDDKLDKLAQWIKDSKHFIVFTGIFLINYIECILNPIYWTGAGVSTSTGIPDFRSAMDTVLPTGPGAWELREYLFKEITFTIS